MTSPHAGVMNMRHIAMNAQWTDFITLLKREVVPALGCTEPMSVALAAANCRKLLGQVPTRTRVWVSGNLFKNGMGVGVPGTGPIGPPGGARGGRGQGLLGSSWQSPAGSPRR